MSLVQPYYSLTDVLSYVFLARKLSWVKWKALVLLVAGSVGPEMNGDDDEQMHGSALGYFFVLLICFAWSTGGVLTGKLLKGAVDSIQWQNVQLYLFGASFGWLAFVMKTTDPSSTVSACFGNHVADSQGDLW